jgi:hypothetical protein
MSSREFWGASATVRASQLADAAASKIVLSRSAG